MNKWKEETALQGKKWKVLPGRELQAKSKYPLGTIIITAKGAGFHDWAAVPRRGRDQHAARARVEIRSWARVVRQFQS